MVIIIIRDFDFCCDVNIRPFYYVHEFKNRSLRRACISTAFKGDNVQDSLSL